MIPAVFISSFRPDLVSSPLLRPCRGGRGTFCSSCRLGAAGRKQPLTAIAGSARRRSIRETAYCRMRGSIEMLAAMSAQLRELTGGLRSLLSRDSANMTRSSNAVMWSKL